MSVSQSNHLMPPQPAPKRWHNIPQVTSEHEHETRRSFEAATGKVFCKVRPRFLRNARTGRNLELDGYCEELQLAFEYDGYAHTNFPNAFHRDIDAFQQQQQRDALKDDLCRKAGVRLIRVPYTLTLEEIEAHVRQRCAEVQAAQGSASESSG